MKKLCVLLIVCLLLVFTTGFAQYSPTSDIVNHSEVVIVVPEREDEEVIIPIVDIIPDSEETEIIQEELRTLYHLIIYYVDLNNKEMATPYEDTLYTGENYKVPSPVIDGYIASQLIIEGTMPKQDLMFVVVYIPTSNPEYTNIIPLDDYMTPLGLGTIYFNVGICFE